MDSFDETLMSFYNDVKWLRELWKHYLKTLNSLGDFKIILDSSETLSS